MPGPRRINKNDWFKNVSWYIIDRAFTALGCMLEYVYNPQKRYDEARRYSPPPGIYLIHIKSEDTRLLLILPDCFKTREMCQKSVDRYLYLLRYVPDWFVTDQQIKICHDNDEYCNNDKLIQWYDGYKKRRAQKASIKEKLLPITWHQSRWRDWCVSEDEKEGIEKLWA